MTHWKAPRESENPGPRPGQVHVGPPRKQPPPHFKTYEGLEHISRQLEELAEQVKRLAEEIANLRLSEGDG
jgi:hypothetical protein